MSGKEAKIRVDDAARAVLLNWKNALPQSLEHHSLSFCSLEDFGAILQTSKGQRDVVTRYLQQAKAITLSPPSALCAVATTACLQHCRALQTISCDSRHTATNYCNRVWLPDLITRNAATLKEFLPLHHSRFSNALPVDVVAALSLCKRLESDSAVPTRLPTG